jgi:single-strand DNA-binding protein
MSQHANEVRLIGRLGATVDERELPSGTVLTNFSIVVDRPAREVHGRTKVDTIACQTTRSAVAARLGKVESGQMVEVSGALRRRFWKSGAGLGSATEVDVARITVIREGS